MNSTTTDTYPLALRQLQGLMDLAAGTTQLGRGKEATNLLNQAAVPLAFVAALAHELTPGSIGDRLGDTVVLEHPSHVQVLEADEAIAVHKRLGVLVLEVSSLVGHLFVLPGQQLPDLVIASATPLAAGQATLQPSELALRLAQVTRNGDGFAVIRQGGKVDQAQVDAHLRALAVWLVYLNLTLNGDKVLAGLGFRHGAVLHLSFNGTVKDGLHPADFGQVDAFAFDLEPLGVANGLFAFLVLAHSIASRESAVSPLWDTTITTSFSWIILE